MRQPIATCLVAASMFSLAYSPSAGSEIRQFHISKSDQMLRLYDNGLLMEEFKISTGKAGYETPSGIFSIIQKREYHESNIYSNAPMPFMQRITWSGIALHEGTVPKAPASHGCIRIPKIWAKHIYNLASTSTSVIITEKPIEPQIISHDNLPGGRLEPDAPAIASLEPGHSEQFAPSAQPNLDTITTNSISKAEHEKSQAQPAAKPLKLLITWRDERDKIRWGQMQLNSLGFDAGKADGLMGNQTAQALAAFKRWKDIHSRGGLLSPDIQTALSQSGFGDKLTNGILRVRQNFKELTEYGIDITEPERELGTHFLQAITEPTNRAPSLWTSVSLPNHLGSTTRKRLGLDLAGSTPAAAGSAEQLRKSTVAQIPLDTTLNRVKLSKEARDFLEANFTKQMSLSITDYSHDVETGQGTDFITITKDTP